MSHATCNGVKYFIYTCAETMCCKLIAIAYIYIGENERRKFDKTGLKCPKRDVRAAQCGFPA